MSDPDEPNVNSIDYPECAGEPPVKHWKRDLAYIREVGPDERRFDEAVQRVWDRIEEFEAALRQIAAIGDPVKGTGFSPRAQEIAREALS